MVPAMLRTASPARLSPALACAALASSLLHAALLVVPLPSGPGWSVPNALPALQARLTPAPSEADSKPEFVPVPVELLARVEMSSLLSLDNAPQLLRASKPEQLAAIESAAVAGRDAGDGFVSAQTLTDMARLGDLLGRAQTEFPSEVSFPVRVNGQIRARYPAMALAQGMEGNVVAWVVVDPVGNVEEIEFAEGDEVFRDAVSEAIKSGQYYPAAMGGQGLRFPIALVFRFALGGKFGTLAAEATPQ